MRNHCATMLPRPLYYTKVSRGCSLVADALPLLCFYFLHSRLLSVGTTCVYTQNMRAMAKTKKQNIQKGKSKTKTKQNRIQRAQWPRIRALAPVLCGSPL